MKRVMTIIIAFFSLVIFTTEVDAKKNEITIPVDLQKKALIELRSKSEHLNIDSSDIEIKFIRELYHTDDSILGYYVNIYKNNELVGFALISAKESLGTLIEFGGFEDGIDTYYGEELTEKLQQKAYYLGLNDIVLANNLNHLNNILEKSKQENIKYAKQYDQKNLKFYEEFNFGINLKEAAIEQQNISKQVQSAELMSLEIPHLSNNDDVSALSTIPDRLTVTHVSQRLSGVANPSSSCGPAVGVMIANYYRNIRGLTTVNNSSSYGGDAQHINWHYRMMSSYFWGTNQYSFHNGLQVQLNANKNMFTAKSRAYKQVGAEEPTFANIINAINKKYPLGLIEFLTVTEEKKLRYHWTVIAAYDSSGLIGYYDSDSGSSMRWTSWSSMYGKVGYTYFALN